MTPFLYGCGTLLLIIGPLHVLRRWPAWRRASLAPPRQPPLTARVKPVPRRQIEGPRR